MKVMTRQIFGELNKGSEQALTTQLALRVHPEMQASHSICNAMLATIVSLDPMCWNDTRDPLRCGVGLRALWLLLVPQWPCGCT